jgi:hypothetical protein
MANRDLELLVRLVTDTKDISKGVTGIQGQLSTFGRTIAGLGAGLGLAVGLREVTDWAGQAIDKARSLAEAQNKVDVVFGDSAATVRDWADDLDVGFRLSELQATQFAGTIGTLTKGMGLGSAETARLSTELVQLGSDIASFNDVSIEEALGAISSGLAGESEPLRRFGIDIREAKVAADGLALGLGGLSKEQQRVASITRQAGFLGITGDALRTADSATGRAEALRVRYEDLQTTIGEKLLPLQVLLNEALLGFVGIVGDAISTSDRNSFTTTVEDAEAISAALSEIQLVAADLGMTEVGLYEDLAKLGFESDNVVERLGAVQDALAAGVWNSYANEADRAAAVTRFWDLQLQRIGPSIIDAGEAASKATVSFGRMSEALAGGIDLDALVEPVSAQAIAGLAKALSPAKMVQGLLQGLRQANREIAKYLADPQEFDSKFGAVQQQVRKLVNAMPKLANEDGPGAKMYTLFAAGTLNAAKDDEASWTTMGKGLGVTFRDGWLTGGKVSSTHLAKVLPNATAEAWGLGVGILAGLGFVRGFERATAGVPSVPGGSSGASGPGLYAAALGGRAAGSVTNIYVQGGSGLGVEEQVMAALRRQGSVNGQVSLSRIRRVGIR